MFSYSEKKQTQSDIGPVNAEEAFKLNLSDLPDWFLEASCCYSKAAGLAWFERRCGDQKLGDFVCRLTCSHCGERFDDIRTDDIAPYFTILIVGHLIAPFILLLERLYAPPLWVHWLAWPVLTVLLTLLVLPRIKGGVLGWMWWLGYDPK